MRRTIASGLLLLGLQTGCERLVPDHCSNQSKDASCRGRDAELPFCSRCESANHGCVAEPVEEACADPGKSPSPPPDTSAGSSDSGSGTGTSNGTGVVATGGSTDSTDDGPLTGDTGGSSTDGDTTGGPPVCGDDVAEGKEACDGEDLKGQDCTSFGSKSGKLMCTTECTLDLTMCQGFSQCDNNMIEGLEECDGPDLGKATCETVHPTNHGGELTCSGCLFNTTNCCKTSGTSCSNNAECCSGTCNSLLIVASCK